MSRKFTKTVAMFMYIFLTGFPILSWGQQAIGDTTLSSGENGSGTPYISPVNDFCRAISVDEQNLWIATTKGLVKMNKITGEQTLLTMKDGLPDNNLLDVEKDKNGNLWICTQTKGIAKWNGTAWTQFTQENSGLLNNQYCTRIAFDADGTPWIATLGALQHFDGKNWETFTSPKAAIANFWFVYALKFDSKGQLWVGGSALDWSFAQMEGPKFKILDVTNPVTAIEEGQNGIIWLGLSNGLATYNNNVLTKYDSGNFDFSTIRDIKKDAQGNLWIASGKQLVKMSDGHFTIMATSDSEIKCIAPDTDGSFWIGSINGDVFRYVKSQNSLSKWISGIQDIKTSAILKVEYYDLNGISTTITAKGPKIIKKTYLNGNIETKKIIVK
jgi:ligand-binding sensor domain-containing protein